MKPLFYLPFLAIHFHFHEPPYCYFRHSSFNFLSIIDQSAAVGFPMLLL